MQQSAEGPATPEQRIVLLGLIGVYPGPQDVYPRIISREISSGYNAKLIIKLNDIWSHSLWSGRTLTTRALHAQDVSYNSALQLVLSALRNYYLQIFIRSKIFLAFYRTGHVAILNHVLIGCKMYLKVFICTQMRKINNDVVIIKIKSKFLVT